MNLCKIDLKNSRERERERKKGYLVSLRYQVALYSGSISRQGNPSPWSVTPYFGKSLTQDMSLAQRIVNAACLVTLRIMHWIMITGYLQPVLRKYLGIVVYFIRSFVDFVHPHFPPPPSFLLLFFWKKENSFPTGNQLPDVRDLTTEIPLTLQNSHYSVADSVPYLANVVNVACLHCRPATQLSTDLETFLQRGESLFRKSNYDAQIAPLPQRVRIRRFNFAVRRSNKYYFRISYFEHGICRNVFLIDVK